jgi:hypothetical protein
VQTPAGAAVNVLDASGRLVRTPEALAHLHDLVRAEPALRRFTGTRPAPLPWGSSALFSAGRWSGEEEVLLKIGVSPGQRLWNRELAVRDPSLVPRTLADGARLADVEVGWSVLERLQHGLDASWCGAEFTLLADAAARFQRAARSVDASSGELTLETVRGWLLAGAERGAPGPVESVLARLEEDWSFVTQVCPPEVCHGDLHLANALVREPAPALTPAVLVDAEPCRTPWVVESGYAQVLNSDPTRAGWRNLAAVVASRRTAHGLPVARSEDVDRAASAALAWNAARMWDVLGPVPDPAWRPAAVWEQQIRQYLEAGAGNAGGPSSSAGRRVDP